MKIVIVAGGTGGHLYPGIAVASALKGHEHFFVVRRGDLGRDILKKEGFPVTEISGQGLPRTLSPGLLTFPFRFLKGWAEARTLLRDFQPDWVLGMGGYLSFPVLLTARWMKIPTLIHEQNVFPGLTNRLLGRWVDSVAVSFPESQKFFPPGKTWVSGLPIRPDMGKIDPAAARQELGLELSVPTFLVFGGSQGARRLNEIMLDVWTRLAEEQARFQVLHITGSKSYDAIREKYQALPISAVVLPYCHKMASAYAAADWVVCRSGASTVAELLAVKRPAFLVPYPYASNDHQAINATVMQNNGLAEIVPERELEVSRFVRRFKELLLNPAVLGAYAQRFKSFETSAAGPAAAQRLANYISRGKK